MWLRNTFCVHASIAQKRFKVDGMNLHLIKELEDAILFRSARLFFPTVRATEENAVEDWHVVVAFPKLLIRTLGNCLGVCGTLLTALA